MIFSTNQIPELNEFSVQEKHQIIALAQQQFTVPEKLSLNLVKLCLLIPPFIFLARQDWGMLGLTALVSLIGFVGVMRPLSFKFANKYLTKVIAKFNQQNAQQT